MKRTIAMLCLASTATLVLGCAYDRAGSPEEEAIDTAESALENSNALNPNALNPNALNPNALNPNALNPNALNPNGLSATALLALLDPGPSGDLSRQLLKYTVSCALGPTQSFTLVWLDSTWSPHVEVYPGLLGLATGWATGALSSSDAPWVSACLASRVNWYGVPVTISSRGTIAQLATTSAERTSYPKVEGAFFGNLFTTTPALYSCYYPEDIASSRAQQRDCATGHPNADGSVSDCGMVHVLGACGDYCSTLDATGKYYPTCYTLAGHLGTTMTSVVTTALP